MVNLFHLRKNVTVSQNVRRNGSTAGLNTVQGNLTIHYHLEKSISTFNQCAQSQATCVTSSTPGSATGNVHGVVDGLIEYAGDDRAIVKSEFDVGGTDVPNEEPVRGEVSDIVISERGVLRSKLGDFKREGPVFVVQEPINHVEEGREFVGRSGNRSLEVDSHGRHL